MTISGQKEWIQRSIEINIMLSLKELALRGAKKKKDHLELQFFYHSGPASKDFSTSEKQVIKNNFFSTYWYKRVNIISFSV